MRQILRRVAVAAAHRPQRTVAIVLIVTAVLGVGVARLGFETSQDALIGESSSTARGNRRYQASFGGEAMFVSFRGPIESLFSETNLPRLRALEEDLRDSETFQSVLGPLGALEFATEQLGVGPGMLAAAKERNPDEAARIDAVLATEATRLVAAGPQELSNPEFVRYLLYDENGDIRPALRDNFLDATHALMIVRLAGNLDIAENGASADAVKDAAARHPLEGFTFVVAGAPVLLQDLNDYLQGGMATLGALAVGVMILVLALMFRRRWRLLSLGVVAVGLVGAFGLMGLVGLPLNLVTISGLPILLGMGVDFAIQVHSRFEEEVDRAGGDDADRGGALVARVMETLGPAIALALAAALVGFVALQMSRVPMIRQFGTMLDLGVAVLFVAVIFFPLALLAWREQSRPRPAVPSPRPGAVERFVRGMALAGRNAVRPMMAAVVVIVIVGLSLEGRFTIQTDPELWLPQDGDTVTALKELRRDTASSAELDLLVEADDVTSTEVQQWMQRFAEAQVQKHPEEVERFAHFGAIAASVTGVPPGKEEVEALLTVAPDDVVRSFISPDRKKAAIAFPIANISLKTRGEIVDAVERDLRSGPLALPDGVRGTPAGISVVGVALVDALGANRTEMTFAALALVAAVLLIAYRNLVKVLLTLTPVLLAVGLSSIVVFVTGVELSPLTAVSGPLVIAVCTEFAIIITARYEEERAHGRTPEEAIDVGTVRIGLAFVASGLTLIGGFAVLATSSLPLLRDFGIVVALNAAVALVSALVLLPPLLMWADRHPRVTAYSPGSRVERGDLVDAGVGHVHTEIG